MPMVHDDTSITAGAGTGSNAAGRWLDVMHVNHELPTWRLRLEEYDSIVDEFHVFECNITQQGSVKPMFFAKHLSLLSEFQAKLHYHEIPPHPKPEDCAKHRSWECENHMRRYMATYMNGIMTDNDVVIYADADEVASEAVLKRVKHSGQVSLPVRVETPVYKYSFHWSQKSAHDWKTLLICHSSYAKRFSDWNELRKYQNEVVLKEGGWHMSTFGTLEQIRHKTYSIIEGFDRQHSDAELERRVKNGISLWRESLHFVYHDTLDIMPKLATTDRLFFEEHFMRYKCDTCGPGGALGATLNLTDSAVSASLFSLSLLVCALSVLFAAIWVKCYKTILARNKKPNDTSG